MSKRPKKPLHIYFYSALISVYVNRAFSLWSLIYLFISVGSRQKLKEHVYPKIRSNNTTILKKAQAYSYMFCVIPSVVTYIFLNLVEHKPENDDVKRQRVALYRSWQFDGHNNWEL